MILEGYEVKPCNCSVGDSIEFYEINVVESETMFGIHCLTCGCIQEPYKTKEASVHHWNACHNILLG